MKTCYICKEGKPESEFNKKADSKDGLSPYCRGCSRAKNKEWKKSPHGLKADEIRGRYKIYGITEQDYQDLYNEQGGRCAICEKHYEILDVDHDHKLGTVRALLCGKCNRGIGMFHDNPSLLRRAAAYVVDSVLNRQAREVLR